MATPATALLQVRRAFGTWALWTLPPVAGTFVVSVVVAWALTALTGVGLAAWTLNDVLLALLLSGCAAVTVEASRRHGGDPTGVSRDMLSAWLLPMALLLPPVYVLLAPLPLFLLVQHRVRRSHLHRRMFSAAAVSLPFAVVSWVAAMTAPLVEQLEVSAGGRAVVWGGGALGLALLATAANSALVAVAVRLANPQETWRSTILAPGNLFLDIGEVCAGVLVALTARWHPALVVVAVPPVLLLLRATLHEQLTAAARLDGKTGLLNGPSWESEAEREIARAARTSQTVSVLLVDLDRFKLVNDTYGHLVGDRVLIAVSQVLLGQTRDYDRCGRFGGDEFAVLLPHSDLTDALHTAERIRRHIEAIRIPVDGGTVGIGTSIGVAQLTATEDSVTELLSAADVSLYEAKAAGRGQVRARLT